MADDGKYAIISDSKNIWTKLLTNTLADQIIEYLHFLYRLAAKKVKDMGKIGENAVYAEFQNFCLGVKDIGYEMLEQRVRLLESKFKNLQKVIHDVLKLNFAVMSVTRTNDRDKVKVPKISNMDFVKKCYESCALEIGAKNPIWFDDKIVGSTRMIYFQKANQAVKDVIISLCWYSDSLKAIGNGNHQHSSNRLHYGIWKQKTKVKNSIS
jgi:hypothetical protein